MAAEIESTFGVKSELVVSKGGCFEVVVDDKLIFSKNESGRFPEDGEVLASLKELGKA